MILDTTLFHVRWEVTASMGYDISAFISIFSNLFFLLKVINDCPAGRYGALERLTDPDCSGELTSHFFATIMQRLN